MKLSELEGGTSETVEAPETPKPKKLSEVMASPILPEGPGAPRVISKPPVPKEIAPMEQPSRTEFDPTAIGVSGATGLAAGLAAPEIAAGVGRGMKGLGSLLSMAPTVPTQALGRALQVGGAGVTAAAPSVGRALPALQGMIGGLLSESAGQTAELAEAPTYVSEGARLAFGLTPVQAVSWAAGKAGGGIAKSAITAAVKNLAKKEGWESTASKEEKAAIEKLVGQLFQQDPNSDAAQSIYRQLERETERLRTQAQARAGRMETAAESAQTIAQGRIEQARGGLTQVGDPQSNLSDIGIAARQKIANLQSGIETNRSAEYQRQVALRDQAVAEKERAGEFVESLPEYKQLLLELDRKTLRDIRAPMREVSEQGVVNAYEKVRDAIVNKRVQITPEQAEALRGQRVRIIEGKDAAGNPLYYREFPTSFAALDDVRRKLGSAAFGAEAEGYEALGQGIAKDLYGKISDIQSKFAGEAHDVLQGNYEAASRLLDKYKGKQAQRYTAIDLSDPNRFKANPDALTKQAFGSAQGVNDLVLLTENDKPLIDKLAGDYIAINLAGKNAKAAATWLQRNEVQDFLSHPAMNDVKAKTAAYLQRLRINEELAGRGTKAVKTLTEGAAATREGAEKMAQTILADKNPVERIEALILSPKVSEWNAVGPLITQSQKGREDLAQAVSNVMGKEALANRQSAAEVFRNRVAPNLLRVNMDPYRVQEIQAALDNVARYVLPEPAKLTFMQDIAQKAIRQYALPRAGAFISEQVVGEQ